MQEIQEIQVGSLGGEDPLEKGMATHSILLAWGITWTEESGELWSMVCKESDTTDHLSIINKKYMCVCVYVHTCAVTSVVFDSL